MCLNHCLVADQVDARSLGGVPAVEYLHALCVVLVQPVRSCALVRQGVPVPEDLHVSWAEHVQPR